MVYGVVIEPDGTTTLLHEPVSVEDSRQHIGDGPNDAARAHPRLSEGDDLYMLVDDYGHAKGLPVNAVATALYGTGWPILGTVIVCEASDEPLPTAVCERLSPDPETLDSLRGNGRQLAEETRLVGEVDVGMVHDPLSGLDMS